MNSGMWLESAQGALPPPGAGAAADQYALLDMGDAGLLEDIPFLFFSPDFSLTDPETFDTVWNTVSDSLLHQEMLSHYLDVIEVELVAQISQKSDSFFRALHNLQSLHDEVLQLVRELRAVRLRIRRLETDVVTKGLDIGRLARRLRNSAEACEKTRMVAAVVEAQSTTERLLRASDFAGALEMIGRTAGLMERELVGVVALRAAQAGLRRTLSNAHVAMRSEFVAAVVSGLVLRESRHVGEEWPNFALDEEVVGPEFDARVAPLVLGLIRTGYLENVVLGLKEDVGRHVVPELRRALLLARGAGGPREREGGSKAAERSSRAALANNVVLGLTGWLESLSAEAFTRLSAVFFSAAAFQCRMLLRLLPILDGFASERRTLAYADSEFSTDPSPTTLHSVWAAVGHSTAELQHVQFGRVVHACAGLITRMRFAEFVELNSDWVLWVEQSEALVGGRPLAGLREEAARQVRASVVHYHEEASRNLKLLLEAEQWIQAPVPLPIQALIRRMASGEDSKLAPEAAAQEREAVQSESANDVKKEVELDGKKFIVVSSALMCVKLLDGYLKYLDSPVLFLGSAGALDVIKALLDLLEFFNLRTCQLVLGAGAMQVAGLKSISSKHLALSSQCLSLMLEMLPHIRKRLEDRIPVRQQVVLEQFERVEQNLLEHRREIFAKLVAIMCARLEVHTRSITPESFVSTPTTRPSPYVRSIGKECTALVKVCVQYLSPDQAESIVLSIASEFVSRLENLYAGGLDDTPAGQKRSLADAAELDGVFRRLPVSGGSLALLLERLERRYDEIAPPASPISAPPSRSPSLERALSLGGAGGSTPESSTPLPTSPAPPASPGPADDALSSSHAALPAPAPAAAAAAAPAAPGSSGSSSVSHAPEASGDELGHSNSSPSAERG